MSRGLKLALAAGIAAALLALVLVLGFRAAVEEVRERLVAALGPGARIAELRVTARTVELGGLEIPGGAGWPSADALRAERIAISPSLRSLAASRLEIRSVVVTNAYLSALRTRDGRMLVVPSLLERPGGGGAIPPAPPAHSASIDRLAIEGGELEVFDASVGARPWRIRLEGIRAEVRDLVAPSLSSAMPFELDATVAGPRHGGKLALRGQLDVATLDLDLDAKLRGADLLAFEPYLVKASDARLAAGVFDLALDAKVRSRRLHAPGQLSIAGLEFAGGDARSRVMGIPRDALLAGLAARNGRIELAFTLEGDLDDPRFSLNEVFATRVAIAMAEGLGISVQGLVEGVGEIGGQSLEGVGKAARGVGSTLKSLLPRPPRN